MIDWILFSLVIVSLVNCVLLLNLSSQLLELHSDLYYYSELKGGDDE